MASGFLAFFKHLFLKRWKVPENCWRKLASQPPPFELSGSLATPSEYPLSYQIYLMKMAMISLRLAMTTQKSCKSELSNCGCWWRVESMQTKFSFRNERTMFATKSWQWKSCFIGFLPKAGQNVHTSFSSVFSWNKCSNYLTKCNFPHFLNHSFHHCSITFPLIFI